VAGKLHDQVIDQTVRLVHFRAGSLSADPLGRTEQIIGRSRSVARAISEVGYWSGMAAFTAAVAYDIVQILQVAGVLRFPLDEILIYGASLCIVVPFVLEIVALHHLTPHDRQFWTHACLIFTGGAPRFLDSVDRQLLWSSVGEKAAQIGERGSVPEG
jgi:hypothetical protein